MPMIELTLAKGALRKEQLDELMHKATKCLMWWEKIPDTPEARKIAWSFVYELPSEHVYIGGAPPRRPRYRYRVHTIEGLMDDRAKQGVMRDLTKLTLQAERAPLDADNMARVWVLFREYPRSGWGIGGAPFPPSGYVTSLAEIKMTPGEPVE